MMKTKGNDGKTVWEHGVDVKNRLLHILKNLPNLKTLNSEHPLPSWLIDNWYFFLSMRENWKAIRVGVKFHDCGKPFCVTTDENGIHHFPKHWELSAEKFKEFGLQEVGYSEFIKSYSKVEQLFYKYRDNFNFQKQAEYYIKRDFEAHILKLEDKAIREFLTENRKPYLTKENNYPLYQTSLSLLLICYCEIVSNYHNDPERFKKAFDRLEKLGNRCFEIAKIDYPEMQNFLMRKYGVIYG